MTAVKAGEIEGLIRRGPDPRIPVILVYAFFSERLIQGMTAGAVK